MFSRGVAVRIVLGSAVCAACAGEVQADVAFQNTFTDAPGTGFYDPTLGVARQGAFVAAEDIWSSLLVSSYPSGVETITVSASFSDLGGSSTSAVIGSASAATDAYFTSTNPKYQDGILYAAALAEHLIADPAEPPTSPEITVNFNSTIDTGTVLGGKMFYYGTDANTPSNELDFETLVLHELCHGLGFYSSIEASGRFASVVGPDAFDTFLYRGSTGAQLIAETSLQRAADILSGDVYFRGPDTMLVDGAAGAMVYAPNPFQSGSSLSHIDPTMPDLMNPVYSGPDHMPSATDLAILSDMGWDVVMPVPEPGSLSLLGLGTLVLVRRANRSRG